MDDRVPEHRDSHASSSHEVSLDPTSTRSEDLGKHSIYTHFPKDRNCEICQRTKITRAPCRRRNGGAVLRAENFGDLITADHKVLSESCESRNNHRYAIVVLDLATQWIQSYPCKTNFSGILPYFCEGPVKNPSIWKRKSYLDCSSDTLCTRGEFGRVTYWLQTLRSWKRWTHLKSTQKDSMQKR